MNRVGPGEGVVASAVLEEDFLMPSEIKPENRIGTLVATREDGTQITWTVRRGRYTSEQVEELSVLRREGAPAFVEAESGQLRRISSVGQTALVDRGN